MPMLRNAISPLRKGVSSGRFRTLMRYTAESAASIKSWLHWVGSREKRTASLPIMVRKGPLKIGGIHRHSRPRGVARRRRGVSWAAVQPR
jgi:hypothetical protein